MNGRKVEGFFILLGFSMWLFIAAANLIGWVLFGQVPHAEGFTVIALDLCLALGAATLGVKWLGSPYIGWTLERFTIKRWRVAGTYFCDECKGEGDKPATIKHVEGCVVGRTLRVLGAPLELK